MFHWLLFLTYVKTSELKMSDGSLTYIICYLHHDHVSVEKQSKSHVHS